MKLWCMVLCFLHLSALQQSAVASSDVAIVNVAQGKPCNMSSQYLGEHPENLCDAANNGNTSTVFESHNCIHTGLYDSQPQWHVDLGAVYDIVNITVYGRSNLVYPDYRLSGVTISIDGKVVYSYQSQYLLTTTYTTQTPTRGRYITLSRDQAPLNICEVQVLAAVAGYRNLALGKRCHMTFPYYWNKMGVDYDVHNNTCDAANNGNANTNVSKGNCIWTHWYDHSPHWTVLLGVGHYSIHKIVVYGVQGALEHMQQVKVLINGSLAYTFPSKTNAISLQTNITIATPRPGNNITLYRHDVTPRIQYTYLRFCEVQVWGTCASGYYGVDCDRPCPVCQHSTCHSVTGQCICNDGWESPDCQICVDGRYGPQTDCQNNCSVGCFDTCDWLNGTCTCRPNWASPKCDVCAQGHYGKGSDCQNICGRGCAGNTCNDDGTCNCATGWAPPTCQSCDIKHYGVDCLKTCGNCTNNTSGCDKVHGECPIPVGNAARCRGSYKPPLCQEPPDSSADTGVAGIAGGVVGGIVAIVAAAIVVFFIIRKRRSALGKDGSSTARNNLSSGISFDCPSVSDTLTATGRSSKTAAGEKPTVSVKPQRQKEPAAQESIYCNVPVDQQSANTKTSPTYRNIHPKGAIRVTTAKSLPQANKPKESGNDLKGHHYENEERPDENSRRQFQTQAEDEKEIKTERAEEEELLEEDIYEHGYLYAGYNSIQTSTLDYFQQYLIKRIAESQELEDEFEKFPRGMPHPHDVGLKPPNGRKNRFKKLCAYDKNRVILKRPVGDTDTDYINASWIRGLDNDRAYIATQGPKDNSIGDVWWMVWQEKITQIVMLTNCKEEGKDKCDEYWPSVGKTEVYGHVTVTSVEEEARADFFIRTFTIKVNEDDLTKQRTVCQYHYTVWPDHGVPAAGSLVNFWSYITARAQTKAPPVVHCSAGVGRTGTYIALDIAMDRKSHDQDVNVFDLVKELREQRSIMVQTPVQYKFLHEVILEAYTSRDNRLTAGEMETKFPAGIDVHKPNDILDDELKLLKEMQAWVKPKNTMGKLEENKDKNRDPNVLPDDSLMAFLSVYVRGRNQYINAVYMSSFKVRRGLLLTQLPLPDTLVDMWRLVEGCEVNTIVSLGSEDEEKTVQNFCQYWPQKLIEPIKTGPYTVSLTIASKISENIMSYQMDMARKEQRNHPVTLLRYTGWPGELPRDVHDVIQLVDKVKTTHEKDASPIVIQCLDGATRSGLFCVLYDVIMRVMNDDDVHVFPTVHHIHHVRPQAVMSEAQYRYCYLMAHEIKNSRVYANVTG